MRILSQTNSISIDFENSVIRLCFNEVHAECNGRTYMLGIYGTEERAQEVFRDIHNAYSSAGITACGLEEDQIIQLIGSEHIKQNVVIMPEDSDWSVNISRNAVYFMPTE